MALQTGEREERECGKVWGEYNFGKRESKGVSYLDPIHTLHTPHTRTSRMSRQLTHRHAN